MWKQNAPVVPTIQAESCRLNSGFPSTSRYANLVNVTSDSLQPSDRAGFQAFAEDILAKSKQVFLKDKQHGEMFFLISEDGETAIMPAPPNMNRDVMVAGLKTIIREQHIYGLVHVMEGWTYAAKGKTDHTMKQVILGEIAVSELQEKDRSEALVVLAESRDGYRQMWMTKIIRSGKRLSLGTTELLEGATGRFAGLFDAD